jgi:hypothetical protein
MLETSIDNTQRFLCPQHRRSLENNPEQANLAWHRLMLSSRQKANNQHWRQAATNYGCAFEVAGLIFQNTPNKHNANLYIQTVVEFSYSLRRSHKTKNLSFLVQTAKYQLKRYLLTNYSNDLLQPILDVAFSPIAQVKRWMTTLFTLDNTPRVVLH